MDKPFNCDIFCNVIDNYGDIGVSWRLARQLANEFGIAVRLWVDDLSSFAKLCPEADASLDTQTCRGVEVWLWTADAFAPLPQPLLPDGERGVADLVIDAFGCALPESYLAAMTVHSVWINLEYLSAEDWVEGCHKLPSPRPPLTRYFFFPGFTKQTGGLLLERDLLARRDVFKSDVSQQQAFWQSIGLQMPESDTLKISLFSYENDALEGLFDAWSEGEQPVLCLVPEGRILPQVVQYFAGEVVGMNPDLRNYARGNLRVRVLPFVEQERYDELLWACDINFVRGEDSCVRAQWAGKPFIWQIYPQHDAVHWEKLQAFLNLYDATLSPQAARAMQGLWRMWNGEGADCAVVPAKPLVLSAAEGTGQAASVGSGQAWHEFAAARGELDIRAQAWARELSANNLALNLLDFFQEIGRMHAFEIEGQ